MKSLVKSIMVLCLFSLCLGQTYVSELRQLNLEVGTTHTFEFYDAGEYVGYNQYIITKKEVYNDVDAYFIDSVVDLKTDSLALSMDASYIVNTQGVCLHYEFEATINGETQTMTADFTTESVHITGSGLGKAYDQDVTITANTLSLDNNMICQWDIMFSAAVLQAGGSVGTNVFAAQPMKATVIRGSISEETITIQAAGRDWSCFKVEFSVPDGYLAYVTDSGQLVKMETPSGLVITLKE
ncbi:MAG: hypothetical protein HXS44_02435 [Theionarchaea archaeon]|nr:hypothetical protein [Theionarchaea archaeon]